jgi:hypothetical protein
MILEALPPPVAPGPVLTKGPAHILRRAHGHEQSLSMAVTSSGAIVEEEVLEALLRGGAHFLRVYAHAGPDDRSAPSIWGCFATVAVYLYV